MARWTTSDPLPGDSSDDGARSFLDDENTTADSVHFIAEAVVPTKLRSAESPPDHELLYIAFFPPAYRRVQRIPMFHLRFSFFAFDIPPSKIPRQHSPHLNDFSFELQNLFGRHSSVCSCAVARLPGAMILFCLAQR